MNRPHTIQSGRYVFCGKVIDGVPISGDFIVDEAEHPTHPPWAVFGAFWAARKRTVTICRNALFSHLLPSRQNDLLDPPAFDADERKAANLGQPSVAIRVPDQQRACHVDAPLLLRPITIPGRGLRQLQVSSSCGQTRMPSMRAPPAVRQPCGNG